MSLCVCKQTRLKCAQMCRLVRALAVRQHIEVPISRVLPCLFHCSVAFMNLLFYQLILFLLNVYSVYFLIVYLNQG